MENKFYEAGFVDKVAFIGNKFSFELKASRRSLMIFEIDGRSQVPFHLLIFELAYINVPSQNVVADKLFQSRMQDLKKYDSKKGSREAPKLTVQ